MELNESFEKINELAKEAIKKDLTLSLNINYYSDVSTYTLMLGYFTKNDYKKIYLTDLGFLHINDYNILKNDLKKLDYNISKIKDCINDYTKMEE